jgi:hypothetical protein
VRLGNNRPAQLGNNRPAQLGNNRPAQLGNNRPRPQQAAPGGPDLGVPS